jgi:hypothetical protein
MSEKLTKPVALGTFHRFPFFESREDYEKKTGQPCPPYNPGRRVQNWFDPYADLSEDVVSYTALAIDKNDPMGSALLKDGKPYLKEFAILPEYARSVNIPSGLANAVPAVTTPPYPAPIDMTRFDLESYELSLPMGPFSLNNPMVRDKRVVELTDHEMIKEIYAAVVK